MKRLLILWLACCGATGCQKKQTDVHPAANSPQVKPTMIAAAATAAASDQSALPAKPSEQQQRALQRYNENAWFIHQALQAWHWDETLVAGITGMVKAASPDWDHTNPSHAEIRGPEVAMRLRPWIEMAEKLEPAGRAAALLVADRIVVMQEEDGNLEPQDSEKSAGGQEPSTMRPKSAAQMQLEKLGSQFVYEPGVERYFYTLNWLQNAYDLDPKGRAGDLAFLLLMGRGFDLSPTCANGSDQFREVIRRGTEFLQGHHGPEVEARAHFLIGDGYRDIVSLAADQHGESYADPNAYKAEAPEARTKAIAQYQAGIALDDRSDVATAAKDRLQHLEAGEPPHDVRFYCQMME